MTVGSFDLEGYLRNPPSVNASRNGDIRLARAQRIRQLLRILRLRSLRKVDSADVDVFPGAIT
jgi:hypothetical protein